MAMIEDVLYLTEHQHDTRSLEQLFKPIYEAHKGLPIYKVCLSHLHGRYLT
jgi:hypothetical protein